MVAFLRALVKSTKAYTRVTGKVSCMPKPKADLRRPLVLVTIRLYQDNVDRLKAGATQERPWQQQLRLLVDHALKGKRVIT